MSSTTQTPVQIAWVTRDLDATETMLTALLGAKKWIRMPGVHFGPDSCTYRGEPADFVADISLSYAGETQLELIAPVSGPSIYEEFLSQAGTGLHHICVETDDLEEAVAAAQRGGAEVVQRGVMAGGMEFAYVSAAGAGVPFVEIARISPEIRRFFDYIKQEQR
jgi:catechol 2,3-dioxygenase-like lactoylglutathione lyase family enzyme